MFILIFKLTIWLFVFLSYITKTCLFEYTENVLPKNEKFQIKNSDIFHVSAQNIDCGYSLEPPRWGGGGGGGGGAWGMGWVRVEGKMQIKFMFCPDRCLNAIFIGSCLALWSPCWIRRSALLSFSLVVACVRSVMVCLLSVTSMARTRMARLPRMAQTSFWVHRTFFR